MSECLLLEASPPHQSEHPRNESWKEAPEAILLKASSQALGILLLNFFFTEGFVDVVAPAASTCQPPSRVFCPDRAFLVYLINSKVTAPYCASSTWRLSCILSNLHKYSSNSQMCSSCCLVEVDHAGFSVPNGITHRCSSPPNTRLRSLQMLSQS